MALSHAELVRRVMRELENAKRVWLSPALGDAFFDALPAGATIDPHPEVVVLLASRLSARGEIDSGDAPHALRTLAVLARGATIVRQPIDGPRADRVFSELGVLDVTPRGLVLLELAPGVSAADFQKHAEPTLHISPRLIEIGT